MKGLLKKLFKGQTGFQLKNRTERAKKRKAELDHLIEGYFTDDRVKEYETLDEMLTAFRNGELKPADVNMLRVHDDDWKRKSSHGGTQSWYVLVSPDGMSEFVVWHMMGSNGAQGYKSWNLRDNVFEEAMAPFF